MGVVLCGKCRRQFLPRQTGNHIRDVHRGENTHAEKVDLEAEKIRKRKERKARGREARALIRDGKIVEARKLLFAPVLPAPSEDCEACLKLKGAA